MKSKTFYTFTAALAAILAFASVASGQYDDRCPRPDEIAPCQCRTRGPTIQVRCINSMMARITEALMNVRKRVEIVDVLILENNNIQHLPSRAFGSVQVNRLFLENNRISSVDRNAYAGVEDFITEIYIKEPTLHILPRDSVEFLRKLTVLSIENSLITDLPKIEGLKQLSVLKVDGSHIRNLPTNGLRSLPKLKYFHVSRSKLSRLDIGVMENLHNLVMANFTDNEISWIHPRAFRYMEQMGELILAGNKLRDASMAGRAARVIKTLKNLDVSRNEIVDLNSESFVDIISLEKLDLSQNQITELKRGAVHRMPSLLSVDLSQNRIKSFHSDSFVDVPKVEVLDLGHNSLNHVTDVSFVMDTLPRLKRLTLKDNEIREIPFGALRGYPSLEMLSLANNQISRVSAQALADLPNLAELDLSKNKLIADAMDGPVFDLPQLKDLNLAYNKLSKLNGKFLSSLRNLEKLDVSHNGITNVNEKAIQRLGELENFNISYNNIRELSPLTFNGLNRLSVLDCSHNEIRALPANLMSDQRNLRKISFAYNQIQAISQGLFPSRNDLEVLDFTSNFIGEFPALGKMANLRELKFRQNAIQAVKRSDLAGLANLEEIDMHDNRIEVIEEGAFQDLKSLKTLDLSLNIISTVGDTLEPLTDLMKLNLSDNYITSLPRNAFHNLRRLSTLDISNNTIIEIGKAFVGMPELKYLDLSHNHLPEIKEGSFKNLPELISLHLDHNSIAKIESDSFQDLWNLESISLSKNGISRIRRDSFQDLTSLERLRLDDNLIQDLDDRSFVDLYSLKELYLNNNLIDNFNQDSFVRVPSLRYLNMSYNLIRDLPRGAFRDLQTVETVDLSHNDIREVEEGVFGDLKWLVNLKLHDNNICRVEARSFSNSESLRELTLSRNRLTRLPQDSFGELKFRIGRLDMEGNPLNCDCNALWLRNLASDTSVVTDEPRCYFPRSLSGNPLRKLRTSRFTCNSDFGNQRSDNAAVADACTGIPLKTPIQEFIEDQAKDGGFYPNGGSTTTLSESKQGGDTSTYYYSTESSSSSSASNYIPESTSTENFKTSALTTEDDIGNDIVVIEDPADDKVGNADSDLYEYYYVYYDESGNIVGSTESEKTKSSTSANSISSNSASKVQEIPLTSNGDQTGDTPTIYAEIKDPADGGTVVTESQTPDSEKEGMTIFGIPIPKLPFNFDFSGLSPVLNSGLLPIGRRDEAKKRKKQGAKGGDGEASFSGDDKQGQLVSDKDATRGPDLLNPIWLETGIKAAALIPKLEEQDRVSSRNSNKPKRQIPKQYLRDQQIQQLLELERRKQQEMYNYQNPSNPVIPLGSSDKTGGVAGSPKYFPSNGYQQEQQQVNKPQKQDYYPEGLQAIAFNHPIPSHAQGSVLPASVNDDDDGLMNPRQHQLQKVSPTAFQHRRQNLFASNNQPGQFISHRGSVDGFVPLFQPARRIPVNHKPQMKNVQRGGEPSGYATSGTLNHLITAPTTTKKPVYEKPAFDLPKPEVNEDEKELYYDDSLAYDSSPRQSSTYPNKLRITPPASEVQPVLATPKPVLIPTEKPVQVGTEFPPLEMEEIDLSPVGNYEDKSEATPAASFEIPSQEEIEKLLLQLKGENFPSLEDETHSTQKTEDNISPNTESIAVNVNHHGTPVYEDEATSASTSTVTSSTEEPEYEYVYEYYYEYPEDYEEGEDSTEENIIEEAPQPLVQLASNDVSASSTEYSSKVLKRRPTTTSSSTPLRSSSAGFNSDVYDSKRSSLTLQQDESFTYPSVDQRGSGPFTSFYPTSSRSSSSSDWFEEDSTASVNWYYKNYNSDERQRPGFKSPDLERKNRDTHSGCGGLEKLNKMSAFVTLGISLFASRFLLL